MAESALLEDDPMPIQKRPSPLKALNPDKRSIHNSVSMAPFQIRPERTRNLSRNISRVDFERAERSGSVSKKINVLVASRSLSGAPPVKQKPAKMFSKDDTMAPSTLVQSSEDEESACNVTNESAEEHQAVLATKVSKYNKLMQETEEVAEKLQGIEEVV